MSSLTWGALGFFLFVLLAGTIGLAVAGIGLWRRIKAVRAAGSAVFGELSLGLAALERRTGAFEHGSADLQRALQSLDRSLRRGRILLGAWRDVRNTAAGWFGFLPRK